ncbi:MAG: extracellular solute-binding protein [Kiritimatiellia bacterium]
MKNIIRLILSLAATSTFAQSAFPPETWQDTPDPLASSLAETGGNLISFAGQYPASFNYYLANNTFSAELFGMMYESLLDLDPFTLEYAPGLAASWTIAEDKKTFTFTIDPDARWSDGTPVTAKDVRWTFDAIMDPSNLTGPHKVSLERFEPPVVIDERTIAFTAHEVHWQNLGAVGSFVILPEHAYENEDFNRLNFSFPVVSGPYRLGRIQEGTSVELNRRDDWWRRTKQSTGNIYNFENLTFRFYAERENAFDAFEQAQIDVFPVYTARVWAQETQGRRYLNNWIVRQEIQNHQPVGFQGFAMNQRRPPFNDIRVRKAMAHLLNRERMNRTLMFSMYFLYTSYFEDLYFDGAPNNNPVFNYDPEKARALLTEAGWQPNPQTGRLEKDGQPLAFSFLSRDAMADRFLQIFNEDLVRVGITMNIERQDWAAWSRSMNRFDYDMTWAAWSAGLFKNPESMWHSSEADRPGGNNITGFRSAEVDQLIEQQKTIFDVATRHDIVRRIDGILTANVPYILLWGSNANRMLYWNRFGTPPTVLSRLGDASSARVYWWFDEDADAELQHARSENLPLPPRPAVIHFDTVFQSMQPNAPL